MSSPENSYSDVEDEHVECNWIMMVDITTFFHWTFGSHSHWGIQSTLLSNQRFMSEARPGDKLWFVEFNTKGHVVAVGTFTGHEPLEYKSEKYLPGGLGADIQINYMDPFNLFNCNIMINVGDEIPVKKYGPDAVINVDVAAEYEYIKRYATRSFD